jgi:hypothetical protein
MGSYSIKMKFSALKKISREIFLIIKDNEIYLLFYWTRQKF